MIERKPSSLDIQDTPERVTVTDKKGRYATLNLVPEGDGFFCGDLESTGNPACIIAMFRRLDSRRVTLWGLVNESQIVHDQIASMYERFGFDLLGTLVIEGASVFLDRNGDRIPLDIKPPTHGGRLYRKLCAE